MRRLVWISAGAIICCNALAFDAMQPGLWETTMTMDMPQGMPQISPEQLAKMKQMGIELPFGHPITNQVCVTPEMAAKRKNYVPHLDPKDKCQMKDYNATDKGASGSIVCTGDDFRGEGHFSATSNSATAYSGTYDFTGTSSHGPVKLHSSFAGRFLAAGCGSVAPVPDPGG